MLNALKRARQAGLLQPHRRRVIWILILTLIVSAASALEPLVLKYVFDDLASARLMRALLIGVGALAALGLLHEVLSGISNWLTWRTRITLQKDLLDITVERLHRLPLSFYRTEGVGAIMTKLDRGVQGVIDAASQIVFNVLPSLIYLIVAIVIMFRLDYRLAVLVLLFAPLPPLLAQWAAPRQIERERTLLERWMHIYSRFNEVLSGIITVKSFTREEAEKRRFIDDVAETNQIVISGVAFDTSVIASQNFVVAIARVAALLLGGWLAIRGSITVGTLVAFLGYVGSVFAPVQGLSGIYRTIRVARVSLESMYSILDVQDTIGDAPDAFDLTGVRGDVTFSNVHFGYNRENEILRGISLFVPAGEMLALVGPSGAGKTTLMSLLQRFYDPTAGTVMVDGIDIRRVTQRSLRDQIGVVLQESLLFNDTIANNIAYGRPAASMDAIEAAAKAANAHDFISAMPDGYQTLAGQRGSRLSAGERQRVAIARALLKDPPILILDEATSALDAETEAMVQDALSRLMKGRTVFVIAHRLATVVNADRVCLLRNGLLEDCGSHAQLMAHNGFYAQLVHAQTRGLLVGTGILEPVTRGAAD